ncbi:MAG: hypothetical protein K2J80_09005 [Oscillospiraceae bacterium]|nr:hypothetical protein [Oscillospiraceae bacterium]
MSKKILAGILAAASILSVSATAFAADESAAATESTTSGAASANGFSYDVSADVSLGSVNVTLPTAAAFKGDTAVVVNPYGAAVKSKDAKNNDVVNTSFIASPAYAVKNNDVDGGLKVIANVSVKKATGLVIVDGDATKPTGWDEAVDKAGDSVRVNAKDDEGNDLNDFGTVFNPLVSYDKITLTYNKEDKTQLEKAVGGAVSAKQANNTAIKLVGAVDSADLNAATPSGTVNTVKFLPKGANGGTLLELGKADNATTPAVGYFTVKGEFNPAVDKESYAWGKENLSLNIVLKVIPTVVDP